MAMPQTVPRSPLGIAAVPLTVLPLLAGAVYMLPAGSAIAAFAISLPVGIAAALLSRAVAHTRGTRRDVRSLESELATTRDRADELDTIVAQLHEGVVIVDPATRAICFQSSRAAELIGRQATLPIAIGAGIAPKPQRRAGDRAHPDGVPFTALIDGRHVDCTPRQMAPIDGQQRLALILTDATDRQHRAMHAEQRVSHDRLTGVLDADALRRTLADRLDALDIDGPLALLLLDIDGFRTINARLGQPAGDRVLQAFSQRLQRIVRDTDVVARVDGDMFAIIQAGAGLPAQVEALARRLAVDLAKPLPIDAMDVELPVTIGAAIAVEAMCDLTPDHLLAQAEVALIEAKAVDAGRFRLHNDSE